RRRLWVSPTPCIVALNGHGSQLIESLPSQGNKELVDPDAIVFLYPANTFPKNTGRPRHLDDPPSPSPCRPGDHDDHDTSTTWRVSPLTLQPDSRQAPPSPSRERLEPLPAIETPLTMEEKRSTMMTTSIQTLRTRLVLPRTTPVEMEDTLRLCAARCIPVERVEALLKAKQRLQDGNIDNEQSFDHNTRAAISSSLSSFHGNVSLSFHPESIPCLTWCFVSLLFVFPGGNCSRRRLWVSPTPCIVALNGHGSQLIESLPSQGNKELVDPDAIVFLYPANTFPKNTGE
ncbi:hypothetical protein EJB05_16262, partial [Eragrostis curvula]